MMTTAWITKSALTKGIIAVEGERCVQNKTAIYVRGQLPRSDRVYYSPDWHESRQEAVQQARLMKAKRIASLEGQLVMLRKMTFDNTGE